MKGPGEEVKEKGEQKGVGTTVSHQKQMFLGAKELLNRTQTFNEVSILRRDAAPQNPTTRPIAVFCRREISDSDVSFAKQYGLPLFFQALITAINPSGRIKRALTTRTTWRCKLIK